MNVYTITDKIKAVHCLAVLALLLAAGCIEKEKPRFTEEELAKMPLAPRTDLPTPSGGIVLAVGNETLTADEIVSPIVENLKPLARQTSFEQFSRQLRPQMEQLLINKVSNILLYRKASKELGDQAENALENAVETEVRKFIADFGGDYAKAEQELKQMGMDWHSFREFQKKLILSQSYISSQMPKTQPITYRQLKDEYDRMKDTAFTTQATIQFRLIDIQPDKLELSKPDQNRIGIAKGLAYEILTKLKNGEDFGELAKQYSHGPYALFRGSWKQLQPESLAKPYDVLAKKAENMKPGQITAPVQAEDHIFIMKLEQKIPKTVEPFEKVQSQIEAKIRLQQRRKAVEKINTEIAQQAALQNKDRFINFCLRKLYLMCNQ